MKVWRVGSNWNKVDIFPIFEKNNIVFAGSEVDGYVKKVSFGDLVAITNGKQILAVAKVLRLASLSDFDTQYVTDYDDVSCIVLTDLFNRDRYKNIDFGIYDGQGKQFHEAHHDYKKNIISIYKKITAQKMLNETKELLLYKKQIILQGPPGTGKTRLAKELANDLIALKNLGSPREKIKTFLKEFNENQPDVIQLRQQGQSLLEDFFQRFPKDNLNELNLENYPLGTGTNDTFCWWLEYGLPMFGLYSGFAQKFLLVYKREEDAYLRTGFIKNAETDEEGMALLAKQVYNVVHENNLAEARKYLGDGFILKLLNTYHPDRYFPVNSEKSLTNILKLLGLNPTGLDIIEKSRLKQEEFIKLSKENNSKASNVEFMRFLFATFDLKGELILKSDELQSKGEKKLIQFHPSYTYEDFVRGIVAKTSLDGNGVLYQTENKTLTKFAQNAIDNPSGNYVLIIDEINRANLSSVLGELIYALEYRGEEVESMYALDENNKLVLPSNLYIIGTMNTADRSVGHIDYAIRRRFAFVDVLPEDLKEDLKDDFKSELYYKVADLFTDKHLSPEFKAQDVQLGHSYFIQQYEVDNQGNKILDKPHAFDLRLKYEIKPILREYVKDGILKESALEEIEKLSAAL